MNTGVISMRYARALYQYAHEAGCEAQLYAGMTTLFATYRQVRPLRATLVNPTVPPAEKEQLICQAAGLHGNRAMHSFARLVVKQQREPMLQLIAHSYIELYRQHNGIIAAHIVTAVPLSATLRDEIKQKLAAITRKQVEIEERVDPAIEGGFIFQVNSNRIDASVRHQLTQLKKQLIERNRRII